MSAENYPFKIGECVIYRQSGIYRIEELKKERFHSDREQLYYVLKSIHNAQSSVFVPAEQDQTNLCLRRPLDKAQVRSLLKHAKSAACDWIADTKARAVQYQEFIRSGDTAKIFGVYLRLCAYKAELEQEKRRFYASDEKLLEIAERLIYEEFSFALGVDKAEIPKLIRQAL